MLKNSRILTIIVAIGLVLYTFARITELLVPYKVVSSANEPTLKVESLIWSSNFKSPQLFDFISFKSFDRVNNKEGVFIYRLCGMPGDKIEIRDAVLYINGKDVDKSLNLAFCYKVTSNKAIILKDDNIISPFDSYNFGLDSACVFLSAKQLEEANLLQLQKDILPKTVTDNYVKKVFNNDWNPDQFGPITVPQNHFFVLGDSLRNAEYSRYIGFIAKEKIIGTLLF